MALLMAEAFPGSPIYTSLYDPTGTFPEFASLDVRCSRLDRVAWFRSHVRTALPLHGPRLLVAPPDGGGDTLQFHRLVPWDTVVGSKDRLLPRPRSLALPVLSLSGSFDQEPPDGTVRGPGGPGTTSDVHYADGTRRRRRPPIATWPIRPPPPRPSRPSTASRPRSCPRHRLSFPEARSAPWPAWSPGYWLCVSRLLPYKNVDVVIEAVRRRPGERLVVVGEGPERDNLQEQPEPRVQFLGAVGDEELRWLYRNCRGLLERLVRGLRPDPSGSSVIRPTGGGLTLGRIPRHASRR